MISSIRSLSHRAAVMALIWLASVQTHAQVFKTVTELVSIPMTVTDRDGERVTGLKPTDFRVLEDGVEQTIAVFDAEERAVSLCIMLDASTSMKGQRQTLAQLTVQATIDRLRRDDEYALVAFGPIVSVPIPWTKVREKPLLDWKTYQLLDGGTVLNDALKTTLQLLDTATNQTAAILIVSDGEEQNSQTKLVPLMATRRQSEAMVYAAQPIAPLMSNSGRTSASGGGLGAGGVSFQAFTFNVLPQLVGDSGGVVYKVYAGDTAEAAAVKLFDDLRNVYTIGYAPAKPPDGKHRRVKVEPRNKDLRVRYRAGYLALPNS